MQPLSRYVTSYNHIDVNLILKSLKVYSVLYTVVDMAEEEDIDLRKSAFLTFSYCDTTFLHLFIGVGTRGQGGLVPPPVFGVPP